MNKASVYIYNLAIPTFSRIICSLILCLLIFVDSRESLAQSKIELQENLDAYLSMQTSESLPFVLDSTEMNGVLSASVKSFLPNIPFDLFAERLSKVSEWCEFVPLHLNIKACLHETGDEISKLGFYVGVKGYLAPDKADLLLLDFQSSMIDNVLMVHFTAGSGPLGSSNYDFHIQAIDGGNGVYLEFDLSSEPGLLAGVAKLYLATVARSKIGFSINGTSWSGEPKYVRGQRGGSERNVVRYLLSIQAYFATLDVEPEEQQYLDRLNRWFALTQLYSAQLYEMTKRDYIAIKLRERKNQFVLLESLRTNTIPVYDPEPDNQ